MLITYRRTGGLPTFLALAAVAAAATVVTVGVAAVITSVVVLGRAVLPRSWRNRTVALKTPWPHQTIDTTAVTAISSDTGYVPRTDDSTR